jgi:penicillin-binding protein 2
MAASVSPRRFDRPEWGISDPSLVRRRAWFAVAFLSLIFLGLAARLWYLQVVEGQDFYALAQANRVRRVPLAAPRGLILDAKGRVLATSRTTHSVCVVPAALPSKKRDAPGRARVLQTLGFLLKMSPAQIEAAITEALDQGGAHMYDPIRILEDAPYDLLTRIEENKPRLGPAVLVTDDLRRFYPNGSLAAHVLGYTGRVSPRDLERNAKEIAGGTSERELGFDDSIGKLGVEKSYDAVLSGERGAKQYLVDSRLRPVSNLPSLPESPGRTLQLTLNMDLQRAAEKALAKARNSGAAVAIDVRTGAVLALASNPTFDPNIFSRRGPGAKAAFQEVVANPKKPMLFRAVTSRFPPASTFKIVTAAAALENNIVSPSSAWHCGGSLKLGRRFGCWNVHGPGVALDRALSHSCDVYFYQAALRMGNPETTGPTYLASVARRFGLGSKTGIDLPVDNAGLIPDPAWRREYNRARPNMQRWFPGNTLNMSIGQGDVLATPLQMALVTAAIANDGWLLRPHLLAAVRDEAGRALEGGQTKRQSIGISIENVRLIQKGMRSVVTKGTGKGVALPHVAIAGKTGSAEDANNALPHAWFVAYAPYDNPRIAVATIIENSGHGSENAVPVCKAILEAAFPAPKKAAIQ